MLLPIKYEWYILLVMGVFIVELFLGKTACSGYTSDGTEDIRLQSTSISSDNEDPLLVLSLLDGSLVGVEHLTGQIRWTLQNDPAVIVPLDTKRSMEPAFLPDPKDGSLYLLASRHSTGRTSTLKKLPFTIQQLVASSPCRSSDGMFYTGRKVDSWFSINWKTGKKQKILTFDELKTTCPIATVDNLFIGRTEYNILMFDSKLQNRHWNITFFDYSSQSMTADEITNYDYVHFGGSASGRVATYRRGSGRLLWDLDLGSPLVAVLLRTNQEMVSVPFTSMEDATLDRLALTNDRDQLFPSLYVGEHRHGLYALPTLVGQQSPALNSASVLLIEGPNATTHLSSPYLGHYPVPDYSSTRLQITGRSDVIIPPKHQMFNSSKGRADHATVPAPAKVHSMLVWLDGVEHKPLYFFILLLILIVTALFFYVRAQVQAMQMSQRSSQGSVRDSSGSTVTAVAEQLPNGKVRVGKIHFDTSCVLGKGCEGTFVFKGEFETRAVAVKRLLPECFTVADREVTLLRESDAHANVVRYFCTEQDTQFRYIALELCAATLQDYVEKKVYNDILSQREMLAQATGGLLHLHTLNIVHRDIKPHNVLLSMPSSSGNVRAMISDFGLCKKLQSGRMSFSRRSGITGTDGWIAPELILGNTRIMCHVDIFSLGCVFYYVMSEGYHPFGDTLHRQANILTNQYRLVGLNAVWRGLVECMIHSDPEHRPSADVILYHPALWENVKILSFLQDVSDRVEKEEGVDGGVLERLETGAYDVCMEGDWRAAVDAEVTADLRKYRTYRGDSVRDLLRALRNKKHHFRELSKEAQELMGPPADSFTDYWLSRFPLLLPHSWTCLQCVRHEPSFSSYYSSKPYTFPPVVTDGMLPPWWLDRVQELLSSSSVNKHSPRQQRGNDTDSPRISRKHINKSPRKTNTLEPTPVEHDEVEKENWMKSGEEKGVYRPKIRRRTKKTEDASLVWTVPPS